MKTVALHRNLFNQDQFGILKLTVGQLQRLYIFWINYLSITHKEMHKARWRQQGLIGRRRESMTGDATARAGFADRKCVGEVSGVVLWFRQAYLHSADEEQQLSWTASVVPSLPPTVETIVPVSSQETKTLA